MKKTKHNRNDYPKSGCALHCTHKISPNWTYTLGFEKRNWYERNTYTYTHSHKHQRENGHKSNEKSTFSIGIVFYDDCLVRVCFISDCRNNLPMESVANRFSCNTRTHNSMYQYINCKYVYLCESTNNFSIAIWSFCTCLSVLFVLNDANR